MYIYFVKRIIIRNINFNGDMGNVPKVTTTLPIALKKLYFKKNCVKYSRDETTM